MHELKNDELILNIRQIKLLVAALLTTFFGCFFLGYFFGQKYNVEKYIEHSSRKSFADEITTALYCQHSSDACPDTPAQEAIETNDHNTLLECASPDTQSLVNDLQKVPVPEPESENAIASACEPHKQYYAPLIGYGTQRAAQEFAKRWQDKGVELSVKKHKSRTSKGKQVFWYQVLTPYYEDLLLLQTLIKRISHAEHLKEKDITIRTL